MPYIVVVDDNARFQDERERYTLGEFETLDDAISACKRVVDDYLQSAYKPGMTAEELVASYRSLGEVPWIDSTEDVSFSARDYAEARSSEICGE